MSTGVEHSAKAYHPQNWTSYETVKDPADTAYENNQEVPKEQTDRHVSQRYQIRLKATNG